MTRLILDNIPYEVCLKCKSDYQTTLDLNQPNVSLSMIP